jgi:3-deoxy-D-manno-octulosonic-acid transferase
MPKAGLVLRSYLCASHAIPALVGLVLRRRMKRGKEDPARVQEKSGQPTVPRPDGPLIWMHGVGLGELLALRGLIDHMQMLDPRFSFLVTSMTRKSAEAMAPQMPANTQHQYLPLDAPAYRHRFLNHWRPDLAIWSDQDLWPGLSHDCAERAIPQAIVAGRMGAASFAKRHLGRGLFQPLLGNMGLISAQDESSAQHLTTLSGGKVRVDGSLKPAAPALACDPDLLAKTQNALKDRFVWAVCPSHTADETIAVAAHQELLKSDPQALLIIAPRFVERGIATPYPMAYRSKDEWPTPDQPIWLMDSTGETGLIYRLAHAVYIGGTNDQTQGHNPWEALRLGAAIYHGPQTGNFTRDYAQLAAAHLAHQTTDPKDLASRLKTPVPDATDLLASAAQPIETLALDLIKLMRCSA